MSKLQANSVGLTLGSLFALAHLGWVILVALRWAKPLCDWIMSLHFIGLDYALNDFNLGLALLLVVVTFVVGYVLGWIFATLWNAFSK